MNFVFARACIVLVFILIKVTAYLAPKEFEGNVHLDNGNEDDNSHFGVLQVYTQNDWNLVCYRMDGKVVMNNAAAAAACRQKGFRTVIDRGLQAIECKSEDEVIKQCKPQKAITGIQCPEVADYSTIGELFLLRCASQQETVNKTNCDDFAKVTCDSNEPGPYNGQIQISKETNVLEIYFEEELRPVCLHKKIARQAAVSACRQLGFTNATSFVLYSSSNVRSWKINDASLCGTKSNNISFSCFTHCIDETVGYVPVESCEDDYSLFSIICGFNKRNDGVYSAGNEIVCTYPTSNATCNQTECYDPTGVIAATVVLSLTTPLLICLVIVLATCLGVTYCKLHRLQQPEGQPLVPYGGAGGGDGGGGGGDGGGDHPNDRDN